MSAATDGTLPGEAPSPVPPPPIGALPNPQSNVEVGLAQPDSKAIDMDSAGVPPKSTPNAPLHQQIILATWKTFMLKWRRKLEWFGEIVIPVILFAALIGLRQIPSMKPKEYDSGAWKVQYFADMGLVSLDGSKARFYDYPMEHNNIYYAPGSAGDAAATTAAKELCQHMTSVTSVWRHWKEFDNKNNVTNNVLSCDKAVLADGAELARVVELDAENGKYTWAGIVLNSVDTATKKWDYTIRMNSTAEERAVPQTQVKAEKWQVGPSESFERYYQSGFLAIQATINDYILRGTSAADLQKYSPMRLTGVQAPYAAYVYDAFAHNILTSRMFLFFFALAFIYPISTLARNVGIEKESKIRESLQMMGVGNIAYWGSWYAAYTLVYAVMAAAVAGTCTEVYRLTSFGFLFFFIWLYMLATISFTWVLAAFFTSSNSTSYAAMLLSLGLYVVGMLTKTSESQVTSMCLLPQAAFSIGWDMLAKYESSGIGVSFDSWTQGYDDNGIMSFQMLLVMLFVDIFAWGMAGWYLDKVLPQTYGVPLPWYFLITKSFWGCPPAKGETDLLCCTGTTINTRLGDACYPCCPACIAPLLQCFGIVPSHNSDASDDATDNSSHIQPLTAQESENVTVRVTNLRKEFAGLDGKTLVAVNNCNMEFVEGQITAFLGHNGAGKTTTMNILTGMLPPTSGDAEIYGHRISQSLSAIREDLGMCPQHDILFHHLTVREHLQLFGRLKGVAKEDLDSQVEAMLKDTDLKEKEGNLSSDLSGGQKRRLSIGIALMGGSKIVFLDEPTTGVDPSARRAIWALVRKYKANRTLILSTHYMEEADLLGDRVLILSKGKLRCAGTSDFLKELYGVGYTMTVEKTAKETFTEADDIPIMEAVHKHIRAATKMEQPPGKQLMVALPMGKNQKDEHEGPDENLVMAQMLAEVSQKKEKLGIENLSLGVTTLEEVFLKVAHEADETHVETNLRLSGQSTPRPGSAQNTPRPSSSGPGQAQPDGLTALVPDDASAQSDQRSCASMINVCGGTGANIVQDTASLGNSIVQDTASTVLSMGGAYTTTENSQPSTTAKVQDAEPEIELGAQEDDFIENRFDCCARFMRHFGIIYYKRLLYAMRDMTAAIWQLLLPPLIILGTTAMLKYGLSVLDEDPLYLSPSLYNEGNFVPYMPYNASDTTIGAYVNDANLKSIDGRFSWVNVRNPASGYCATQANKCMGNGPFVCKKLQERAPLDGNYYYMSADDVKRCEPPYKPPTHSSEPDYHAIYYDQLEISNHMYYEQTKRGTMYDVGFLFDQTGDPSVSINATDRHAAPIGASIAANLLYKSRTGSTAASISATSWPFALTTFEKTNESSGFTLLAAILYGCAFAFYPASWCGFAVRERESKAMHQQLVSGVSVWSYWLATWAFDFTAYLLPCTATWAILACFSIFPDTYEFAPLCVLTLVYGAAAAPFTYAFSFICNFKSSATALSTSLVVFMIVGLIANIAFFVLDLIIFGMKAGKSECPSDSNTCNTMDDWTTALKYVFYCFPPFSVGWGFQKLGASVINTSGSTSKWHMDNLGYPLLFMGWTSVAYFIITVIFQYMDIGMDLSCASICPPKLPPDELAKFEKEEQELEEDVDKHRKAVEACNGDPTKFEEDGVKPEVVIMVDKLRKVYPARGNAPIKFATKDMCLAIPAGECFGLLGVNGAGKTTTMDMLTGDSLPTGGHAWMAGFDVTKNREQIWQRLGYCPQFDALFDLLTAREHLEIYGRIRGIKADRLAPIIENLLTGMDLQKYADKQAGTYSGGNKRKLSVAIALIGNPKIVVLDEPSSGMDPEARRSMWAVIQATKRGRVLILTSHFMDECEYLCDRVGIMVDGRLKCLGSNAHLKDKFGNGYVLTININADDASMVVAEAQDIITKSLQNQFQGCQVETLKTYSGQLRYRVSHGDNYHLELHEVFEKLVVVKSQALSRENTPLIKNFLAGHTSLEQVFLSFAGQGEEGEEAK